MKRSVRVCRKCKHFSVPRSMHRTDVLDNVNVVCEQEKWFDTGISYFNRDVPWRCIYPLEHMVLSEKETK